MAQEAREAKPPPGTRTVPSEEEATAAAPSPSTGLPLMVLSCLAVLAAVYIARDVLIPVVLASLLALLLRPLQRRLWRWHVPDYASSLLLITAVVALFVLGVLTLAGQAQQWLAEAPAMVEKVGRMLPTRPSPMDDLAKTTDAVADLTRSASAKPPLEVEVLSSDAAYAILGVSSHFVGASIIVFVVGYFLLAMGNTLLRQAVEAQPSFLGKRSVVQLVQNVEQGISRYLLTITAINVGLGIVTGFAMWLLRVPNPVLWGVLAGVANFVPYLGGLACLVVLTLVSLVTFDSLWRALLVPGVFLVLDTVHSNVITPLLMGRRFTLNTPVLFVGLLFWWYVWGVAGALLAVPLLSALKIVCERVPGLQGIAIFLGDESDPG